MLPNPNFKMKLVDEIEGDGNGSSCNTKWNYHDNTPKQQIDIHWMQEHYNTIPTVYLHLFPCGGFPLGC